MASSGHLGLGLSSEYLAEDPFHGEIVEASLSGWATVVALPACACRFGPEQLILQLVGGVDG